MVRSEHPVPVQTSASDRVIIDRSIVKPDAVARLKEQLRSTDGEVLHGTRPILAAAVERFGRTFNRDIEAINSTDSPGDMIERIYPGETTTIKTPRFLNKRPRAFPIMDSEVDWEIVRPDYDVLRARNATLRLLPDAPIIINSQGRIIDDYSSEYWPLMHFYDGADDIVRQEPKEISGAAIVLIDDVWGLNYCHWMADWLPRAAALQGQTDKTYVLTSPIKTSFQTETLQACGFRQDKIIPMEPWTAVRATELIVPPFLSDVMHPSFRGSRWATSFVKDTLLTAESDTSTRRPDRLYISRSDAPGRRILNEAALISVLERYNYQMVTLSGMSVREQAKLFNSARFIIGMHGAGLTNILFGRGDATLVEIFADTYGTLSFWILAASMGKRYASYLGDRLVAGPHPQFDNVEIDIGKFESEVLAPLHGAVR